MPMGYNTMNVMRLGINSLPPTCSQGFRCASPPACGLPPLTGLNGWAFSFVCVRFFTARSQGFRCAPPPACGLSPLRG